MSKNMKKEYILCSAIWYKDLRPTMHHLPFNVSEGVVLCGWRHGNIIAQCLATVGRRTVSNAPDGVGKHTQGFLTNTNRFVDRGEGGIIAFDAGQTEELKRTLYSEDLW